MKTKMTDKETIMMCCIIHGIDFKAGRTGDSLIFRDYRYTSDSDGEVCKVDQRTGSGKYRAVQS